MKKERDYILGTNDEEIQRLGLQHRVWRSVVLNCWNKAGITVGSKVIDVGAGPGYAALDLAEIVGPEGQVTAVERSAKFLEAMRQTCRDRGLTNIDVHEKDLMSDELPGGGYDFSWCRWVASFVPDPALLVRKIAGALRPGGRAIFHEYGHYQTWEFSPRFPEQEEFKKHVIQSWRETGGKTDIGLDIPPLAAQNGLALHSITPHMFCVGPREYMWQWPAAFLQTGPARLQELGKFDQAFTDKLLAGFAKVEADPDSLMVTPVVLEIVVEKSSA
jgi:ubiquinone/menaquinone biosynthesis C-methylase UbiE